MNKKENFYNYYKTRIEAKGWTMISTEYINGKMKLEMCCDKGHNISQIPSSIKSDIGCGTCHKSNDNYRNTRYEYYKNVIENNGGKIISTEYKDNITPINYYCIKGHNVSKASCYIEDCPCTICYQEELEVDKLNKLQECKQILEAQGWNLITEKYINSYTKMDICCNNGHKIQKSYLEIKLCYMCPDCKKINRQEEQQEYYDKYKNIIESMNWRMISTNYIDANTKLKFYCENNHIVEHLPYRIGIDKCQSCPNEKYVRVVDKIAIYNKYCDILKTRGWKMISQEYVNHETELEICCNNEHYIKRKPGHITEERGCAKCYNFKNNDKTQNKYYNYYKNLIESKGGKMISEEYIDSNTKLKFYCNRDHIIEKLTCELKSDSWCSLCYREDITIKRNDEPKICEKLISDKEGIIISINDNIKRIEFYCKNNHYNDMSYYHILGKSYCLNCYYETLKYFSFTKPNNFTQYNNEKITIDIIQQIVNNKGGKCLSEEYINMETKMLWKCADGHEWYAVLRNIIHGNTWCPQCRYFLREEVCRKLLENMFDKKFIKIKPDWLKNDKGYKLELDCYNESIPLAIEVNGEFHYMSIRGSNLQNTQMNDAVKIILCEENKIPLIIVPYTVKLSNLQYFLVDHCNKAKINIPNKDIIDITKLKLDYKNELKKLQEIAKNNEGELLSNTYLGYNTKLQWKCKHGHIWNSTPSNIKKGSWCKECHLNKT